MNESLKDDYRNGRLILFVGAGVSASIGLPPWSKLIDLLAEELEYDPSIFKTYGDYLTLAEYYSVKVGSIGKLRSKIDKDWHNDSVDISDSIIHKCIVNGNFPIIYTTNYDNWIENAFDKYGKKYIKVVNVNDIANCSSNKTEIIKLHGDFSDDSSIVLTESSYFERLQFETPLDIKLRSDILGKSVLFIGYSLKDINIRHLFYKLSNLWRNYGGGMMRPKSYIFSSINNPVQEEVLKQWGIETLNSPIDDSSEALCDFLQKLTGSK